MSGSKSARYHARRRQRLLDLLGNTCRDCGDSTPPLEIAHLHGNGGENRRTRGTSGEISRLLSLAPEELHAEATLLCRPCHVAHDLAAGHLTWKGERTLQDA